MSKYENNRDRYTFDKDPTPVFSLIDDWKATSHRLWSVRAALLCSVLNGAVLGLAAFVDVINPWWFLGLNVAGYGAVACARLLKQPGLA